MEQVEAESTTEENVEGTPAEGNAEESQDTSEMNFTEAFESTDTEESTETDKTDDEDTGTDDNLNPNQLAEKEQEAKSNELDWNAQPEQFSKAYKSVQGAFTQSTQEVKSLKENAEGLQGKADFYDQLDQLAKSNPEFKAAVNKVMGNQVAPTQAVDETLQSDPLFQYVQTMEKNQSQMMEVITGLQAQDSQRKQDAKDQQQRDYANTQLDAAKAEFETMFGQKPNDINIAKMREGLQNEDLKNQLGQMVARHEFGGALGKHKVQQKLDSQKAKQGITTRTTSLNSSKANKTDDSSTKSFGELWAESEQEASTAWNTKS